MSVLDTEARRALDDFISDSASAERAERFVRCAWDDLARALRRLASARGLRADHLEREDIVSRVLEALVRDVRERGLVPDEACIVRRLKNRLVDVVRSRARWTERVGATLATADLDISSASRGRSPEVDRLADREAARGVLSDIAYALRDGESDLLRLRLVEERSFDEIAAILGDAPATLRQRLRRILARIRRTFAVPAASQPLRHATGTRAIARGPPRNRGRRSGGVRPRAAAARASGTAWSARCADGPWDTGECSVAWEGCHAPSRRSFSLR